MKRCSRCKKELTLENKVTRREACPFCGWDLHVCLNCRFYDPGAYNQCREPQAERVLDKERSNFCDYFLFRDESTADPSGGPPIKEKLANLFKKK